MVRVDSVGGDFGEAMAMTEALRRLSTRQLVRIEVLAHGRCESMCTVLWTAAAERVAAPGARFMFHAPRRPLGGSERHFAGTETETEAMRQAIGGVDPALLAELERRGAFAAIPIDVPLTAAEIAALGGDYLRLDPALR
ncbi:MAG: ATP-dependent Clp protease proteolytic subunit [Geminicoccaceae bacterium]